MKLANLTTGIALIAVLGSPGAGAEDQKMLEMATTKGCFICHSIAPTAGAVRSGSPFDTSGWAMAASSGARSSLSESSSRRPIDHSRCGCPWTVRGASLSIM